MRSLALALSLAALASGCGGRTPPCCRTAVDLYPSHNGDIPVCPWMFAEGECHAIPDYDADGTTDADDLTAFCQRDHDGDYLTLDTLRPGDTSAWCFTCD